MPGEAAPPAVDRKDDKVVDMARMPRFLRREKAGRADEELLLDIAAPEAAAPAMAPPNPPGRPQLVLVSDVRTEEVSPSRPPSVYLPQPDPVFLHAPPPVPPPGADPARLASERLTAPGVADLIDRLERALAQTRDEAHPSAEQAALKAAIVQLDALMTAAGR
jgi:hypothetical protein